VVSATCVRGQRSMSALRLSHPKASNMHQQQNKATVSPLFCFSPKLSPTTATLAHGSRVLIP
jgi:hypothetical protein